MKSPSFKKRIPVYGRVVQKSRAHNSQKVISLPFETTLRHIKELNHVGVKPYITYYKLGSIHCMQKPILVTLNPQNSIARRKQKQL